jgi:hypothetical protein
MTHWPVIDGIAVFGNIKTKNELVTDEMKRLLNLTESSGWDVASFEYAKSRIAKGSMPVEDQRMADWKYLLSLNNKSSALVLGCGWGTVPIALSEICANVYAIDTVWEKIVYLNILVGQHRINNLYPIYVSDRYEIPFPKRYFNLITVREYQWSTGQPVSFRGIVRRVYNLLSEEGVVSFSIGNRLAFQYLLRRTEKNDRSHFHNIFGYKHILQEEGFSDIQFYAPLPDYDGIPLFYVPVENNRAMAYFFHNIFPLFEMVSPEVKRLYAFDYKIAKIAVRLALSSRLTSLAKFFVPGFIIIAKKQERINAT